MTSPRFFAAPEEFRTWLESNHAAADELWVGFYKKGSGKPSMTWPQSVDGAVLRLDRRRSQVDRCGAVRNPLYAAKTGEHLEQRQHREPDATTELSAPLGDRFRLDLGIFGGPEVG